MQVSVFVRVRYRRGRLEWCDATGGARAIEPLFADIVLPSGAPTYRAALEALIEQLRRRADVTSIQPYIGAQMLTSRQSYIVLWPRSDAEVTTLICSMRAVPNVDVGN